MDSPSGPDGAVTGWVSSMSSDGIEIDNEGGDTSSESSDSRSIHRITISPPSTEFLAGSNACST